MVLDWVRQDPEPSASVLEGLLLGRSAPPQEDRMRIEQPALVIGHPADPLHPFNDADQLVDEMPNARLLNANSILEWRAQPRSPQRRAGELPRRGVGAAGRGRQTAKHSRLISRSSSGSISPTPPPRSMRRSWRSSRRGGQPRAEEAQRLGRNRSAPSWFTNTSAVCSLSRSSTRSHSARPTVWLGATPWPL